MLNAETLREVYGLLFQHYGPQHWWPADSIFEMLIGSILVQNTNWSNVEKALDTLGRDITPRQLARMHQDEVMERIRPCGYYKTKALRIKEFANWCLTWGYLPEHFAQVDTAELRSQLLEVTGIGKETADCMLLYAYRRPVFVIDAYTRRLLNRMDWDRELDYDRADYDDLAALFVRFLGEDAALFNEYHALIVALGKDFCRKSEPACAFCPLSKLCAKVDIPGEI